MLPLNYEKINNIRGHYNPSTVKARNNRTFRFWEEALYERLRSKFNFNLPEEWNKNNTKDFFDYVLFKNGFILIANEKEFGVFCMNCELSGYGFYYQPTDAIVSNPMLSKTYKIGVDCEIVSLPYYVSAFSIIDRFAEILSNLDNSINTSIINCKFPFILGGKGRSASQALKVILDEVSKGNPAIIYDRRITSDGPNDDPFQFLSLPTEHLPDAIQKMLEEIRIVISQFDSEVGISSMSFEKKERMVAKEAESLDKSSKRIDVWIKKLNECFSNVNKMFGTNMSVNIVEDRTEESEVSENVTSENNNVGNV